MEIVVIGGSYFVGRVFTMFASKDYKLTLVNRGTYCMKEYGVKECKADRKNCEELRNLQLPDECVVVDFCAYEQNDIKNMIENLPTKIKQYIMISTVDVYKHDGIKEKKEGSPLEDNMNLGDATNYINGKIQLEKECKEECENREIPYTILRPAIIYGPYNYSERESSYIKSIIQGMPVYYPADARGEFQFVYVKDVVTAIQNAVMNEKAYDRHIHLAADEILTYEEFIKVLKQVADRSFLPMPILESVAEEAGLSMPYPVSEHESQTYDNSKSKQLLELTYTSIEDGMQKTYNAFKGVFA